MSHPIWPIVTENLAEQLSAAQGGVVHPIQLLPYLPISLHLAERVLDELAESQRVEKQTQGGLTTYLFNESIHKTPHKFAPRNCVYSNEPLDDYEYSVLAPEIRQKVEAELSLLAQNDIWPADAVWQHELAYLSQNLNAPTSASDIAGHSRLSFKKVELRLNELKTLGALRFNNELQAWEEPPMRYPRPAYARNDSFIRQFPGAIKEELEIRLVKGLSISLVILVIGLLLAVTAKLPFPFVLFGSLLIAFFVFLKIIKAPAKQLPDLNN